VKLLAQQKTNAGASGGQELIRAEPVAAGSNFADAAKANQAQTPREDQAIFQLSGKHVAIEVTPRSIATQLIVRPVDAVAIKGRLATRAAKEAVVGQNLLVAKAPVFVERNLVGRKRIFTAEALGEEVSVKSTRLPLTG
jgi:hypothetical protein